MAILLTVAVLRLGLFIILGSCHSLLHHFLKCALDVLEKMEHVWIGGLLEELECRAYNVNIAH